MILDIYKDSFEFASKKVSSLIILGVLAFFNILIIPLILFSGYNYNVVKLSTESMINGGDVPPEFTDLKEMFINGLKYLIVVIAYTIIPILIMNISIYLNITDISIIGFTAGLILYLVASLFAYLAIPHMASNSDSLKSAFKVIEIKNIMSQIGYGRYIATYIGIGLISIVIVCVVFVFMLAILAFLGFATFSLDPNVLGAVGIFGILLFNFVLFLIVMPYLSIFQNRCMGLIYNLKI